MPEITIRVDKWFATAIYQYQEWTNFYRAYWFDRVQQINAENVGGMAIRFEMYFAKRFTEEGD